MSTDLETLLTLAAAGNLPATTDYLMSLPHDVRADAIKIVRSGIPKPQAIKLRYDWPLYARGSQLPPEEDWDTWRKLTWPSDAITPIIQITRITVQTTPTHSPTNPSCQSSHPANPDSDNSHHSPDRADALVHAITDLILDRNPVKIW